jgi:HSP20 family protein
MSLFFPITRMGHNNANFNSFDAFSLIDDLFTLDTPSRSHRSYNTTPRANVVKTDTGYGIELAVPGFSRDEFEMNVENDRLTIAMGTEDTKEYEDKIVHREYRFANFKRTFSLPENTNIDGISARYEAGILYIDIPVEEKNTQTRVITVQ